MKKLTMFLSLCTVASALWMQPAQAQFAKPEDAVKYRQSALTLISSHFGRMQSTVKGATPYDAAAIQANVEILKTLSVLPWAAKPTAAPKLKSGQTRPGLSKHSKSSKGLS